MEHRENAGGRAPIAVLVFALTLAAPAHAAVVISAGQTANMDCASGLCAPTAKNAVLNASDLENLLASENVTVTTTGSGVQAKDIIAKAAFGWASTAALTLDAYQSIAIDKPISIAGLSGLSLVSNDGGRGGILTFGSKGNIAFQNLSSSLSIDGTAYALAGSVATLASAIAANPAGAYALASNYDASKDGTYTASPIATTFTGSFEGLGNSISGLAIADSVSGDPVGLFRWIGAGGTAADLRLRNVNVAGRATNNPVGGLAGVSDGTASGVSSSGSVTGGKHAKAGGLVGEDDGAITNCTSSANVNAIALSSWAGGLVGYMVGESNSNVVNNSSATGSVTVGKGTAQGISGLSLGGGLVGATAGVISGSFATGAVKGRENSSLGGLVGSTGGGTSGAITNSYATGSVTGAQSSYVGGLVGYDTFDIGQFQGAINDAYATGAVVGGAGSLVGGFSGHTDSVENTTDGYWDTTTSGTNVGVGEGGDAGITGLTTQQLQAGLPAGFDPTIWAEKSGVNSGFPYLLANPPPK